MHRPAQSSFDPRPRADFVPRRMLPSLLLVLLACALAGEARAEVQAPREPARVLLLGLFHFDNPGLDAVKYTPLDVMQPAPQAYLAQLARNLAAFAPTKVLLEYPESKDALFNQRYAEFRAGRFELPRNEIYQIGFRVARLAGLARVHGFDVAAPANDVKLWGYLEQAPQAEAALMQLIAAESARLQAMHSSGTLEDILVTSNTPDEDLRNKGFYMLLNPVGADQGLFHGADASADWWHRNLRMYAVVQRHAAAGERVLLIAGSGHTALLRDFLRADAGRREEDVIPWLRSDSWRPLAVPSAGDR